MPQPRWLAAIVLMLVPAAAAGQAGQGAGVRPDPPARPVPVAQPSTAPALVHKVDAEYSDKARRAGIQGDVLLDVSVLADGKVGSVFVAKSLDTLYGLDQRAIAAVRQWVYAARPNGDRRLYPPTPVVISFRLPGDAPVVAPPTPKATEVFGEGAYRPGTPQLVLPKLKSQIQPTYTTAGLRARITGAVKIDAVVLPDGTIGQARIAQSLDAKTGLDEQALGAAREWTFVPGTLNGRAVPVIVTLILEFRAH